MNSQEPIAIAEALRSTAKPSLMAPKLTKALQEADSRLESIQRGVAASRPRLTGVWTAGIWWGLSFLGSWGAGVDPAEAARWAFVPWLLILLVAASMSVWNIGAAQTVLKLRDPIDRLSGFLEGGE